MTKELPASNAKCSTNQCNFRKADLNCTAVLAGTTGVRMTMMSMQTWLVAVTTMMTNEDDDENCNYFEDGRNMSQD